MGNNKEADRQEVESKPTNNKLVIINPFSNNKTTFAGKKQNTEASNP
jgi:hypothetical protein